jgi:hypothetical protein
VINESWFAGWKATIDGRDVRVLRGNVVMQTLQMPAGAHVVVLRFRPGYVLYPLALAFAAWLGALGWVLRGGRITAVTHRVRRLVSSLAGARGRPRSPLNR